jgi:uracil-DNA glycosylase family 4
VKPIVLLGEAWGEKEARIGQPFVGPSGIELLRMLDQAEVIKLTVADQDYIRRYWQTENPELTDMVWRLHPEVVRMNVFNLRPENNDISNLCGPAPGLKGYPKHEKGYIREDFRSHLHRLSSDLDSIDPVLVVCLGSTALWALCGTNAIKASRGRPRMSTHTISGFKCLPVYHPAYILRNYSDRPITILDLSKAPRLAQTQTVEFPKREIWIEPSLADMENFFDQHVPPGTLLSVDIETARDFITCIGFAPTRHLALVVPFYDGRRALRNYWPDTRSEAAAWGVITRVLQDPTIYKLFQNGLYDIGFLYRSMKIRVMGARHDTMLLHHALQPELEKGLEFLGSVYTEEGNWKREHRQQTSKRGS